MIELRGTLAAATGQPSTAPERTLTEWRVGGEVSSLTLSTGPLPSPSVHPEPQISPEHFALLNRTISEALQLAADGRLADGYSFLLQCRRAVEDDRNLGIGGTAELVRIYLLATDNYVRRFGISLE